ncbi:MAG: MarC family protein [Bacteroidales bacterium]|nr:MarC family protein [Bacteroidales bacterium]
MNTQLDFIVSTAILFFLLMDPFGNLPLFISILSRFPERRYRPVVIRESVLALSAMVLVLFTGQWLLHVLALTVGELQLAGGVILLIMGTKMVFSNLTSDAAFDCDNEPFCVPLAIPLICGPGEMAMLITLRGSTQVASASNLLFALLLAWFGGTVVLLCGRRIARCLGNKVLDAVESLMGLLLTAIAVGMLVSGMHELYGIGPALR